MYLNFFNLNFIHLNEIKIRKNISSIDFCMLFRYGINDNCLFHVTKNIPNRSMLDIREKISEIRELARLRHEMQVEARKTEWLKGIISPSKTSEVIFFCFEFSPHSRFKWQDPWYDYFIQ